MAGFASAMYGFAAQAIARTSRQAARTRAKHSPNNISHAQLWDSVVCPHSQQGAPCCWQVPDYAERAHGEVADADQL
jgi:hypothetical protein